MKFKVGDRVTVVRLIDNGDLDVYYSEYFNNIKGIKATVCSARSEAVDSVSREYPYTLRWDEEVPDRWTDFEFSEDELQRIYDELPEDA